jgi:hypothetical protein
MMIAMKIDLTQPLTRADLAMLATSNEMDELKMVMEKNHHQVIDRLDALMGIYKRMSEEQVVIGDR